MQHALTNIDELEIRDAFRTKIDLGEGEKKYAEVEWVALDDKNGVNHTTAIRFDTMDLKDRLPVYRESYAAFPVKAISSGAAYDANTKLAFKCSVLSLINTLSVRPAGSGPQLVNEINNAGLPLMNNLRLLTESDIDWIECSGEELHFFGCDRNISQNVGGAGIASTCAVSHVSAALPTVDMYSNQRLADRVAVFTSLTDHVTAATAFGMIISIPLKFIHSFFDQLSFPLPNYPMKIEFGLSSISSGQDGFMPLVTPTRSVINKFDAAGASAVQAAVAAAPKPSLSIDPNIEIMGYSLGACRLFVKCVTLAGKDAEDMEKALSSGYKKTITYLTTEIDVIQNVPTSANGTPFHKVFFQETRRPERLWVLFPPAGALASKDSLFPGTVGPCYVQNCNVKVNNSPLRRTNWMNQLELYNELRQYQLGSGYRQQQGAPISYSDFVNGTRPYLFDLSRHVSVRNNMPITFTFDGYLVDPAGGAVDVIFLVERYQTAFIDISRNKASTDVQSGLPRDEKSGDDSGAASHKMA